jgi:hypothetical protein
MAASPVTGPAPDSHAPDPLVASSAVEHIDPAVLAKFDTLCSRMALIAEAVNTFADPSLRERAFYELVSIINPSPPEPESVELIAEPRWGDAPASAVEIGRLAEWITDKAPGAWRDTIQPGETTVDATIRFLADGDLARAELNMIRHALIDDGGFSVEQTSGPLPPLIREMSADAPVSPEVEELALRLKANAEPGETAVQVALRLMRELQLDKTDERGGEREPQPVSITAAAETYKREQGL